MIRYPRLIFKHPHFSDTRCPHGLDIGCRKNAEVSKYDIIKTMDLKDTKQFENYFLIILLLLAGALVVYIFFPYLSAIVFAIAFAVIFSPLYRWLRKFVYYDGLAAFVTVMCVILIVLVPFGFFVTRIVAEATHLYAWFAGGNEVRLGGMVNSFVGQYFGQLNIPQINITDYVSAALGWVVQNLWPFVGGLARLALIIFLSLFGMFYLLKDGGEFKKKISSIIPLQPQYSKRVFDQMERAIYSVIGGSLMIALIHGIEVIVGFWIFGIPNAAFWGSFAVLSAIIPTVGTSLVNIPAIIYLFATGNIVGGAGLFIWWVVVSFGFVDNFLSPQIVHHGMKVHPFLILLSVLGGISVFGLIGFLIGPLALAFFFALTDIYPILIYGDKMNDLEK